MGIKRVLTSIVLIPILYVIAWKLPYPYFAGLIVLATLIGQQEFYRMARSKGIKPLTVLGMVLGVLIVIGDFYGRGRFDIGPVFFVAFCLLAIMIARLFSSRPVEGAIEDIAVTLLGIFYVALLF